MRYIREDCGPNKYGFDEARRMQMMANAAWRGLKAQGFIRSMSAARCATRGPYDFRLGRHRCCAVGWLMPDGDHLREGAINVSPIFWAPQILPATERQMSLATDLRQAHDCFSRPEDMADALKLVFAKYELDFEEADRWPTE